MKYLALLTISFMLYSFPLWSQSVGIGTNSPQSSAILEMSSSSKGMLAPRMSSAQRIAIASPAKGLLVFDNDSNSFWYFNGTNWVNMISGSGEGISFPFDTTIALASTAFRIINNATSIHGSSSYGSGILGTSSTGAGVTASSGNYYGVSATSGNNTAIYAYNNHANPTIYATNANAIGVGIKGNSNLSHGIVGVSGGTSTAGVRGEGNGLGGIGVFGTTTSNAGVGIYGNTATGTAVYGWSNSGTGVKAYSASGLALDVIGKLKIAGGNTTPSDGARLTSDANGNATWVNNRVAFSASGFTSYNGLAESNWLKVELPNEQYDYANNFSPVIGSPGTYSSVFTVPKTALYHIDAHARIDIDDDIVGECALRIRLRRNGIVSSIATVYGAPNEFWDFWRTATIVISRDVKLMAGDQVWLEARQSNWDGTSGNISFGEFNAHLIFED